jgi:hypothetical protein
MIAPIDHPVALSDIQMVGRPNDGSFVICSTDVHADYRRSAVVPPKILYLLQN